MSVPCPTLPLRPVRLLVSDLDGTLVGSGMRISARSREAVRGLAARGCAVAIATGRMIEAALPFVRELGVTQPLVAYNGAWVRCLASGTDWHHRPVPQALVAPVVSALEAAGLHVNLYLEDRVHMRALTPEGEAYLAHARVEPALCGSWEVLGPCAPTKILAIGPEDRVTAALAELRPRYAGRLWLTQSMPTFLEVTHAEANKGAALAQLAARLGFEPEEVVAVGDNLNDLEMLAWAGTGVAMGNAHPELIAAADHVTASVADDGVAELIDHLVRVGRL